MSEYPEDVMKATEKALENWQASIRGGDGIRDIIARAIMTERQRCADLSKSEAEDYKAHDCLPQAMALFQFAREVMKPPSSAASS